MKYRHKPKGWRNINKNGNTPRFESWRHSQAKKGIRTGKYSGFINKIVNRIHFRTLFSPALQKAKIQNHLMGIIIFIQTDNNN